MNGFMCSCGHEGTDNTAWLVEYEEYDFDTTETETIKSVWCDDCVKKYGKRITAMKKLIDFYK